MVTPEPPRRSRGSSSEQARTLNLRGHANARLFAEHIGMESDYRNDRQAKKDVIDPSGDAHSVKSGGTKWQILLYSRSRFETDDGFQALNGIGELLIHCIDTFPPNPDDYDRDKLATKQRLRTPMRELKDRFQRKALLRAFLMKSFFNGGEVNYLSALHTDDKFHVFLNTEAVRLMGDRFEVVNSVARGDNPPEQKVLFRVGGNNVGELEMRTDGTHYVRVRFNMIVPRIMELLLTISPTEEYSDHVIVHGDAIRRFGNW